MDFLKTIGEACRRHYEKFLLSIVLLGLAAAVIYLNKLKEDEDQKIKEFTGNLERSKSGPLKPVDLSRNGESLKILTNPPPLNFSLPHHLFNPVKWQRRPAGDVIKMVTGEEVGWPKMTIARIPPLHFIINLERVPTPGSFYIGVTHEGAERAIDRKKKQRFATLN